MSIETIFPTKPLSQTEEDILAEIFSNPVVAKYLRILATEDSKELLALSAVQTTDTALIKAHATVHGKLQVIGTLLSIAENQTK